MMEDKQKTVVDILYLVFSTLNQYNYKTLFIYKDIYYIHKMKLKLSPDRLE